MAAETGQISKFRLNHVGYMKQAPKYFIVLDPPAENFKIEYLRHCEYTVVLEGTLRFEKSELGSGWVGDFSSVTAEGDYRIRCGDLTSRNFVIWDKAYDMAARLMLNFFTMQRCGHPLGWAGVCHQDDGYIAETGEHIDLKGGYHQSCDLRKSPGGLSIAILGMVKFASKVKPIWGTTAIPDEVRWACDYLVKSVQPNGCMYNTLNESTTDMFGWAGRIFYKSGAPANAQWNTMRALTIGSSLIKDRREIYLETARRMWNYLTTVRPAGKYCHPAPQLPRGMDAESFYTASFKNSTADICARLAGAADFYRVTSEQEWLAEVEKMAVILSSRFVGGKDLSASSLRLDEGSAQIMESAGGTYGWLGAGIWALCDALELLPDSGSASTWRACLESAARSHATTAEMNLWRLPAKYYSDQDLDAHAGHPVPGQKPRTTRDRLKNPLHPAGKIKTPQGEANLYYSFLPDVSPTQIIYSSLLLKKAAVILNRPDYKILAQRQLDLIFGANAADSSNIESVGHNQRQRGVYGQFFPSTPQIPGAVNLGRGVHSEYDLPNAGFVLWALGDLVGEKRE